MGVISPGNNFHHQKVKGAMTVLEFLKENPGWYTIANLHETLKISKEELKASLLEYKSQGFVKSFGQKKGTYYATPETPGTPHEIPENLKESILHVFMKNPGSRFGVVKSHIPDIPEMKLRLAIQEMVKEKTLSVEGKKAGTKYTPFGMEVPPSLEEGGEEESSHEEDSFEISSLNHEENSEVADLPRSAKDILQSHLSKFRLGDSVNPWEFCTKVFEREGLEGKMPRSQLTEEMVSWMSSFEKAGKNGLKGIGEKFEYEFKWTDRGQTLFLTKVRS